MSTVRAPIRAPRSTTQWAPIPATPRIGTAVSPTTVPPSSAASSASVRSIMSGGSVLPRALRQLLQDVGGQIQVLVHVDDEPSGAVEHQAQSLVSRHLLDRA